MNKEGYKEVLGMYISKSEGANFWLCCSFYYGIN
ncbi:hypothetical protein [Christiangramia crocea]